MTDREAIILFIREEEAKHTKAAAKDESIQSALRLDAKASILRTMAAYIERGDHLIGHDAVYHPECSLCGYRERVE